MFSDKYLLVAVLCNCIIYHIRIAKQFSVVFFRRNPDGAIIATTKCGLVAGIWMHACIQVA